MRVPLENRVARVARFERLLVVLNDEVSEPDPRRA
jgi:hypothetical protein